MTNRYVEAARKRGEARTAEVERKVRTAMETIMAEIQDNDGIYPHAKGRLSKNEFARRAGISLTTLFTPKQKELAEEVDLWLEKLRKTETIGTKRVRREYKERAADWEARYNLIADNLCKAELETQAAEAERDKALAKVQELEQQIAALLEQLRLAGASNVKPFPKGGKS
jgi:hypothetical protein